MAKIDLHEISVEFPVYNLNARSFKKQFMRLATGGMVVADANQQVVVNALNNISLNLKHGDRLGLIGHNGSGKSTLLRLLAGIYEPTRGSLVREGNVSPLLDIMLGMEGEFTGHENILQRGVLLGLSHKEIKKIEHEIVELTGLGDYLHLPLRTYSSGMMVRLAFAISASIHPEILLIDEVFAAGDADFLQKAHQKMISLLDESSIVVMANHSDNIIEEFCNKALLLESGNIKFLGPVKEALDVYHGRT